MSADLRRSSLLVSVIFAVTACTEDPPPPAPPPPRVPDVKPGPPPLPTDVWGTPSPAFAARSGPMFLQQAVACIEKAEWGCAEANLIAAEKVRVSKEARTTAALRVLEGALSATDRAKRAKGKARAPLLEHAALMLERAFRLDPDLRQDGRAMELHALLLQQRLSLHPVEEAPPPPPPPKTKG